MLSELCACLCVEGPFWLKISLPRPSHFPVRPASSGSRATIGFVEPQELRVQTTCAPPLLCGRRAGKRKGKERRGIRAGSKDCAERADCLLARAAHCTHGASKRPRAVPCRDGWLPPRGPLKRTESSKAGGHSRCRMSSPPVTAERRQRRNLAAVRAPHENLQNRRYSR